MLKFLKIHISGKIASNLFKLRLIDDIDIRLVKLDIFNNHWFYSYYSGVNLFHLNTTEEHARLKNSMSFLVNLIFSALLVTLGVHLYRKKTREKRINAYFCTAVRIFALTDEEDARLAILAAAKVSPKKQRGSMVKYLQSMALDIKNMSEIDPKIKPHTDKFAESSIELAEEISSREWTINDINKQKEELGKINSEYLAALDNADPSIFSKKHPQLIK